jgi:hypothetical protein
MFLVGYFHEWDPREPLTLAKASNHFCLIVKTSSIYCTAVQLEPLRYVELELHAKLLQTPNWMQWHQGKFNASLH